MAKMRKLLILLICGLLIFPCASAEIQAPAHQGAATDWAGVLGHDTMADTESLSQRLESALGGKIYVVTRHFLGGAQALEYGQYLFDAWELGEMDALLLMVIGEENYALILGNRAGKMIPAESQNTLLANHFRAPYLDRDYDGAVSALLPAYAENLSRAAGKTVDTAGLFGRAEQKHVSAEKAWNDLWSGMFAQVEEQEEPDWAMRQAQEETETNWRTVIIWGLVIYFLFFRKKKRRRARRGRAY